MARSRPRAIASASPRADIAGIDGGSMESGSFFIAKAAQCRRLAAAVDDGAIIAALLAMADKMDALAAERARREDSKKTD